MIQTILLTFMSNFTINSVINQKHINGINNNKTNNHVLVTQLKKKNNADTFCGVLLFLWLIFLRFSNK